MSDKLQAVTEGRPAWTQADVTEFQKFLGTAAGAKFRLIINYDEQATNRKCVKQLDNPTYRAGYGAGFSDRSTGILTLSADLQPQSEEASGDEGAESLAERNAP